MYKNWIRIFHPPKLKGPQLYLNDSCVHYAFSSCSKVILGLSMVRWLDKTLSHCHWMCFMWNKKTFVRIVHVFFPPPFCCGNSQVTSGIIKDFQPTGAGVSSSATKSDLLLITGVVTRIHVVKKHHFNTPPIVWFGLEAIVGSFNNYFTHSIVDNDF